ncbi:TY1B-PL [Symbiodinium microadriaticum]|nr:TY1B-PL [Symbiodinium microadriaticum]
MIHGMKLTHGEELHLTMRSQKKMNRKILSRMEWLPQRIQNERQCPRQLRGVNGGPRWGPPLRETCRRDGVQRAHNLRGCRLELMVQVFLKGGLLVMLGTPVFIQGGLLQILEVLEFSALTAFLQGGMLDYLDLLQSGGLRGHMCHQVFLQGGKFLQVFLLGGLLYLLYFLVLLQGGLLDPDRVLEDAGEKLGLDHKYHLKGEGRQFLLLGRRAVSEPAPSPAALDGAAGPKAKPDHVGRLRVLPRSVATPEAEDVGSSSAGTSEIKSLLRRRARGEDRPKSSIGSVKIEDFHGDRRKFKAWRRAIEAQEHLYRLEQSELAMLLYLSTKGEARDILDQRPLSDFTAPGGLAMMWKLLEETYGENSAESFERAEKELAAYRRLPGQSVASYVAGLKRLKMNYVVEDPDSTWSNKAWAQRLLNRAGLSRRDRLDVFYSAGAQYDTEAIEKALRHRCSHIHEEERRVPSLPRSSTRSSLRSSPSSAASTASGSTAASSSRSRFRKHSVHVAGQVPEDEPEDRDDEDLEQEALDGATVPELLGEEEEEELQEEPGDLESEEELPDVYEAFQAGWKAKAKVNFKKKARGYRTQPSAPSTGSPTKSLAAKKRASTCASCGGRGHWKGDPECPNVMSGRDPLHKPGGTPAANEVNFVNYTFMVSSLVECPGCQEFCDAEAAFCAKCGTRLCKREWSIVDPPPPSGAPAPPGDVGHSASTLSAAPPRPMRVELPKSAVGKTKDDKKLKLKPLEVLGAVDQLSKEEKKALKVILQKDEEEQAWATLRGDCPYVPENKGLAYEPPPRERPGAARASDDRRGSQGDVQMPHGPGHRGYLVAPSLKDHNAGIRPKPFGNVSWRISARCHHRYNDLLWTANQHGHFARCSRCDLKHVIYYSVRHGVLMASHCMEARENTPTSSQVPWAPGLAVADTGCRTAVGGIRWHRALQEELQRRGIQWKTVPEEETFQFGSGDPVVSTTAVFYPVSLVPGMCDVLRMSVVEGPATLCPGLIGPSELSRWGVNFDFRTRQIVILDHPQEMRLTPTRHPALDLLGHLGAGDPWGRPGMQERYDLLCRAPQSRGVPEQNPEAWPGSAPQSGSKLERLHLVHRRLGHPANEVLVRMLQMGGADEELVKMARGLQCPTCQMRKQPTRPLPTRPGTRPIAFNFEVHLDLKYIKDAKDELYVALSMVDAATCFHAARLLRCREPAHVAGKFMSGWIALFGVPVAVVLDQGGEFETEFIALLEAHSVASKVTGSHAPWQNGFCERQGALLGVAWSAAVQAEKAEGRQAMKISLACALQAKNATVSRRGHSAHQLVFGRQAYLPELLDEEVWQAAGLEQALSLEGEVARQSEMRAAAKIALLHGEVHEKLKAALRRAPGGQNRAFSPGEMVFFWSPASDLKRRRYRRDAGAWRGPAVVLLPDGAQKYFISWRGRCLLVAAANMKLASLEAADDHDLRLREAEAHLEKGFVDLSQEPGPSEEEEAPHSVQGPGIVVRRRRNALGRKMSEARNMMSNLKSVKKMLKVPLRGRRRPRLLRPVEAPPREQAEQVASQDGPAAEEDDPNAAGPPPDYVSEGGDSLSSMGEAELDDLMYRPPPSPETLRRRRRDLLDDVPAPVREIAKRRRESDNTGNPEVEQEEPAAKRLKDQSFYNYILAAVSEGEVYQEPVLKNEWLSRAEVDYLGELLDIPLEAVRLHRAPRKRLQAPGGNVRCHRTTLMLKPEGRQVLVAKETPGEMKLRPRRRVPFLWRGLTLFSRPSRRVSKEAFVQGGQEQSEKVFVEKDGVPFQLPPVSEKVFWAACRDLGQATRNSEAFLLKLKASGKELDPRFFDSKEAKAFEEADAAEWAAWTKNNVVRRLSREEAARVPRHRIFRVPARVVRTNKAAVGSQQLIPKSRIVLPGHLDPDVGEIRTDSPTTQATAVRMTMILCVSKRWVCLLFDVSTAFLSGKEVGRELYVRPPRDLKGAGAQELWLVLRSAYGLAEAPRLWYERAKELLKDCGFEELSFALCTFVWKHPKTKHVMAVLCLHVDDGMLAGDPKVVYDIKTKINERFQIKVWNLVKEQPLDYLGLKVFVKNGIFYNDMTAYVQAIQAPDLKGLKKGELLAGPSLKAYRRLVAQLRWPAHHVLPELLFEVSCLAQRVSGAKTEDLKEGVALLARFHEAARQGKASLAFYPVSGKPTLVTFFDASLGKTAGDAAAQRGEVHFLTGEQGLRGPCAASILEFHSNKIARVVRSSMAAECCSLAASADKLIYNQKLLDALWYGATLVGTDWRTNLQTAGHLVTDAKSVYDHLHGTSMASERQTALDILAVRQQVQEGVLFLHWIPTWRQYADGLTKAMPDLLFEAFRRKGTISLAESPEDRAEEERRASIRRGQRERRKARMRPT